MTSNVLQFHPQSLETPADAALKPKSLEDRVREDIGEENAEKALKIIDVLATTAESMEVICSQVVEGKTGNQAFCIFAMWRRKSPSLATLYTQARMSRADVWVDQIVAIANEPMPFTDPHQVKAEVERRKLMIEARKWTAGKFNRLLYDDNPSANVGVQVNVNTDAGSAALAEITRRLNRKREAKLISGQKSMLAQVGGGVRETGGEGVGGAPNLSHSPRVGVTSLPSTVTEAEIIPPDNPLRARPTLPDRPSFLPPVPAASKQRAGWQDQGVRKNGKPRRKKRDKPSRAWPQPRNKS